MEAECTGRADDHCAHAAPTNSRRGRRRGPKGREDREQRRGRVARRAGGDTARTRPKLMTKSTMATQSSGTCVITSARVSMPEAQAIPPIESSSSGRRPKLHGRTARRGQTAWRGRAAQSRRGPLGGPSRTTRSTARHTQHRAPHAAPRATCSTARNMPHGAPRPTRREPTPSAGRLGQRPVRSHAGGGARGGAPVHEDGREKDDEDVADVHRDGGDGDDVVGEAIGREEDGGVIEGVVDPRELLKHHQRDAEEEGAAQVAVRQQPAKPRSVAEGSTTLACNGGLRGAGPRGGGPRDAGARGAWRGEARAHWRKSRRS